MRRGIRQSNCGIFSATVFIIIFCPTSPFVFIECKHSLALFLPVYVESSDCCNDLSFTLGTTPIGVTVENNRMWSIKVHPG